MTTIHQATWEAKGEQLFGTNKEDWRFVCPACGHVASIAKIRAELPELKGKRWAPGQECVGRFTDKVDCDWCAYGLFRGPLVITAANDGREVPYFDFEGRPFTREPTK